jgi:hypothetical protein
MLAARIGVVTLIQGDSAEKRSWFFVPWFVSFVAQPSLLLTTTEIVDTLR